MLVKIIGSEGDHIMEKKHNHITCVYIIKAICLSGDSCNNTTSYILSHDHFHLL